MGSLPDTICIGDKICIYATDILGYVFASQSSSVYSEVAVQRKVKKNNPNTPHLQVVSFEVCIPNRYKLNKIYRKTKSKFESEDCKSDLLVQLNDARRNAETEREANEHEQKKRIGSPVYYGQLIQLRHDFTGKYVHVSTKSMAKQERTELRVELNEHNAKNALFKIMPKYKVKVEGDLVQSGDQVVFESVKSVGQYLHVSKELYGKDSVYAGCHELNLSICSSPFAITRRYKPGPSHLDLVQNGSILRLFHKECEAYLCAEGLFDYKQIEDVHLRVRELDFSKPKTIFPTTSALNYWQVELQHDLVTGEVIRWHQPILLKHLLTRKYLNIDAKSLTVNLVSERSNAGNVFRIHPVVGTSDFVVQGTYCRIEHVISGTWLHNLNKTLPRNSDYENKGSFKLNWTTAVIKKLGVAPEMQFADAFSMLAVNEPNLYDCFYVLGMVPFLQKLVTDLKHKHVLDAKESYDVCQALAELRSFMVVDGHPMKNRQKLLRNMMIIELLVAVLKTRQASVNINMGKIYAEIYQVLQTYLLGESRKNELYMAKYLDFFQEQIKLKGSIGLNASHMVTELIRDNRKIIDRITNHNINMFVALLEQEKNFRYLELLEVLCVCDGVSMSDNQTAVTNAWLKKSRCVYHTALGQDIGLDSRMVYVSWDNKQTWSILHEFAQQSSEEGLQRRAFLVHQLDLFGKLCQGRNKLSIDVITEELGYLTWEEAFICLSDEQLPDSLRAKYCELIIVLFVDVDGNDSVLDNVTLTFIYDNIAEPFQTSRNMKRKVHKTSPPPSKNNWMFRQLSQSQLAELMVQLQEWIARFLDQNRCMKASEEGQNLLIGRVLSLVKYLVQFGYYSDIDKIKKLREPLLRFLDGRNDLPYPMKFTTKNPDFEEFIETGRFKNCQKNHVIVDAKCQTIEVLDLLMNFSFNLRLEAFVGEFKGLHQQLNTVWAKESSLAPLLKHDFDLAKEKGVISPALETLKVLFEDFQQIYQLKDILMDLSRYDYDQMVTRTMSLLNRFHSVHENLFTQAVQAQIVITDVSCEVHADLQKLVPELKKLSMSRLDSSQSNKTIDILEKLIKFCCFDRDVEIHPMNQVIIYNYGVLTDVFELLSQEIDLQLTDKYGGFQKVVQKCCTFLQVLAKDNAVVQARLFDRLDLLLGVQGAEEELALALTEVFTGNKKNCLRVESKQIQKMVQLAANYGHKAPQLFTLLNAVVKVDELDLPLKRNQDYVMKYFTQYRAEFANVLECKPEKRLSIVKSRNSEDYELLVAIIDLMAACAEGENKFIESLCQSVLGIDEILDALSDKEVDKFAKRAYARFLEWVYLRTGEETTESGRLAADRRLWEFIESLPEDLEEIAQFAKSKKVSLQQILRRRHDESSPVMVQSSHDTVHYLIDAVIPFLETYFHSEYSGVKETLDSEHKDVINSLARALLGFSDAVLAQVTRPSDQKQILGCLYTVIPLSNQPINRVNRLQDKYGNRPPEKMKSNAQKRYEEYYDAEISLNEQFNLFAQNYSRVFGGMNTVQAQIGYPSDEDYTEVGEDEDLPLGPEFQSYINCFIDHSAQKPKEKYSPAAKLLQQLEISANTHHKNEKHRLEQQALDLKCMQVLRGMIHNQVVRLPTEWEGNPKLCQTQLNKIEEVQNALVSFGAMPKIVVHLNSGVSDDIIKEALAVMVKLLFNGNTEAQESLLQYFKSTREERFFVTIKSRMQIAALAVKESRTLVAQHQSIVQDALDQIRMMKSQLASGKLTIQDVSTEMGSTILKAQKSMKKAQGDTSLLSPGSKISLAQSTASLVPISGSRTSLARKDKKSGRSMNDQVSKQINKLMSITEENDTVEEIDIEALDEKALEERLFSIGLKEQDDLTHGQSYMALLLRVMGYLCDGQNRAHQEYMREQSDNFLSCDLVGETVGFLGFIYGNVNGNNIEMTTELLQTLVEFVSGNYQNQVTVFEKKICDYLDFMLQGSTFMGCSEIEILELKKTMGNLIRAMTEENAQPESPLNVPKVMMENLEAKSLVDIIRECYHKSKKRSLSKEAKGLSLSVAFQFYHILLKMLELSDDRARIQKRVLNKPEDEAMWKFLERKSVSVEVMKDNQIHTVRFPILYKSSLREEVKTVFNYEVDRSASERIHDFMDWVVDLKKDIFYTRKILDTTATRFFVKMWYPANIMMMFLSFVYMVLITIAWVAPTDVMGTTDASNSTDETACSGTATVSWTRPELRNMLPPLMFLILSIIHVVFTMFVVVAYFIINKPRLPSLKWLKKCCRRDSDTENDSEIVGTGKLDTHFFSIQTFYYISLMVFSVLGLYVISYGYFLAYHMLHIAEFNQLLKRAIKAVTKNGLSLIMIFIFGVFFIFIFAQINFAFYRELYGGCESDGVYCRTMYECFTTVLHRGLIVSLYEAVPPPEGKLFTYYLHKALTDLLFFMLISVVGLDIIFGIVVDTFAELRDSKWNAEQEMKANCFICGIDGHSFEKKPGGFDHHVKKEHCQWAYVFLFMHLEETRVNDYTSLELYVSKMLSAENFDFFPINRALSLEHEVDEKEERIKYLEEQVSYLVNKIKQQEVDKKREIERLEFKQWESKHKTTGGSTSHKQPASKSTHKETAQPTQPRSTQQQQQSSQPTSRPTQPQPQTRPPSRSPARPTTAGRARTAKK